MNRWPLIYLSSALVSTGYLQSPPVPSQPRNCCVRHGAHAPAPCPPLHSPRPELGGVVRRLKLPPALPCTPIQSLEVGLHGVLLRTDCSRQLAALKVSEGPYDVAT